MLKSGALTHSSSSSSSSSSSAAAPLLPATAPCVLKSFSKTSLLGSLQEESERSIRTKVADTAVRPLPLLQP